MSDGSEDNTAPPENVAAVTEEDCRWAYQSYSNTEVAEGDAPSKGAFGLLTQIRKDSQAYRWLVEKLSPKSFAASGSGPDEAVETTGIDKMLRAEFQEKMKRVREIMAS